MLFLIKFGTKLGIKLDISKHFRENPLTVIVFSFVKNKRCRTFAIEINTTNNRSDSKSNDKKNNNSSNKSFGSMRRYNYNTSIIAVDK